MIDGSSLLMNTLGVLVAFSAVILVLSILVTSLAQASQAVLRLRARNLERGLAASLEPGWDQASRERSRKRAADILNSPDVPSTKRRKDPNSFASRVRGPLVSWIDPNVLRDVVTKDRGEADEMPEPQTGKESTATSRRKAEAEAVVQRFEDLEIPMKKRFATEMRAIALVWAFVVAAVFQVSTPALMERLSTDPKYRAQIEAGVPGLIQYSEGALTRLSENADASGRALDRLIDKYPEIATALEQARVGGGHPEAVGEELAAILENHPDRASIVTAYDAFLVRALEEQERQALGEARTAVDQLATISITPWRYGSSFYVDKGSLQVVNLLGVLTTTILLTLGAPFWFDTLKRFVAFRDVLAPPDRGRQGDRPADSTGKDRSEGTS